MDILEFYASQSSFTDPGRHLELYKDVPGTPDEIVSFVQNLCLDVNERWKYPIQNERFLETSYNYVDDMIDMIAGINRKVPVFIERPEDMRKMSSVSDFTTFACSFMRHHGIPARKRVGFVYGVYIEGEDPCYQMYEIVEYYDKDAKEWKQVDPIGRGLEFIPAGDMFFEMRKGLIPPEQFKCFYEEGYMMVVAALMLDLAAVTKHELICWDRYGWMDRPINTFSDNTWNKLSNIAELLTKDDKNVEAILAAYDAEEGVQVPQRVFCNSPVVPPHYEIIREGV